MKRNIKINESKLCAIVNEALNELGDTKKGQERLMYLKGKNSARLHRLNLGQDKKEHNLKLNDMLGDEMWNNGNDEVGRGIGDLRNVQHYVNGFNDEADKIQHTLNEANCEGWEVDESEATEAYNLFAEHYGNEAANAAIVRSMGAFELSKCLAYIFQQYEFRPWKKYQNGELNDDNMDNDSLMENEERYMSDSDIANQYSGMNIIKFEMEPTKQHDGWSGRFELEFPNADGIDYDDYVINNFITYDPDGNRIAWDDWMPDEQTKTLEDMIRKEIAKRKSSTSLDETITRIIRKYLK